MITLYHGSYTEVHQPLAKAGRRNLDFGRGFYLTKLKEQAEAWAAIIASRKGRNVKPVVSVFQFDEEHAKMDGTRFRIFPAYDLDWLNYVVDCRQGKDYSSEFDIVEGGVANDNVIDTVEDYMRGRMSAEAALVELSKHRPNNQFCILNQEIIDYHLRFIESIKM